MKKLIILPTMLFFVLHNPAQSSPERFQDVIVVLKSKSTQGTHNENKKGARDIAKDLGVSSVRVTYGTALYGFAARIPEQRLAILKKDSRVQYVVLDKKVSVPTPRSSNVSGNKKPCWVTNSCGGGGSPAQIIPWNIKRIGADTNSNEGIGAHVYILDSGIDSDHIDLAANLGEGFAATLCVSRGKGKKAKGCPQPWDDDHGHGTHVAGTIGAIDNEEDVLGVASQATLHAVKVLNSQGSGSFSDVIAGIDWVADQTKTLGVATVANMSLGGSGSKTGTCSNTGFSGTDAFHQAICNAKNAGVVFAVAAGNEGIDSENKVPAAYDDAVMTVSATQEGDNWPSWSNWGDGNAAWTSNLSAPVAIAAPGVSVLSTKMGGGTTEMSGTSMAAPNVAGSIALYLSRNTQSADSTAFTNARAALLSMDESTAGFSNTSGYPHDEDFLNAGSL